METESLILIGVFAVLFTIILVLCVFLEIKYRKENRNVQK
jgi:hypothetical protein